MRVCKNRHKFMICSSYSDLLCFSIIWDTFFALEGFWRVLTQYLLRQFPFSKSDVNPATQALGLHLTEPPSEKQEIQWEGHSEEKNNVFHCKVYFKKSTNIWLYSKKCFFIRKRKLFYPKMIKNESFFAIPAQVPDEAS